MTPPAADSTPKVTDDARRPGWAKAAPWIFGILVLSALVAFVLHRGEVERFAELARGARPSWLLLACAAQAATYFSLAAVWWRTLWCAGHRLDYWSLVPLSVAKLFTDQAVPTGGVSGILLVVKGLNRRGVPSDVAAGNMVVGIVSFYAAYILVVLASIAVMWLHGRVNHTVLIAVSAFGAFAVAVPGAVLALRRWSQSRAANWIKRFKPVRRLMDAMAGAPMGLLRKPVMMTQVTALQAAVFLLDALTLWLVLKALGQSPAPWVALVGFTMASVAATIGPIPLGLGTFEAGSVGMLSLLGQPMEAALAATLIFRGLTFWLPMLPGLWLTRREIGRDRPE